MGAHGQGDEELPGERQVWPGLSCRPFRFSCAVDAAASSAKRDIQGCSKVGHCILRRRAVRRNKSESPSAQSKFSALKSKPGAVPSTAGVPGPGVSARSLLQPQLEAQASRSPLHRPQSSLPPQQTVLVQVAPLSRVWAWGGKLSMVTALCKATSPLVQKPKITDEQRKKPLVPVRQGEPSVNS